MQRMGMVLGLKPETVDEYKRLHAAVWPEVLAMISACNISNYSIYPEASRRICCSPISNITAPISPPTCAKMAADPKTQEWWAVCMPLPGAARHAQGGRVVGDDGRGVPS